MHDHLVHLSIEVTLSFKEIYAQTLTAGWTGQVFSADARIRYEQTLQRSASREKELRTHHWELSADTAVKPGKGWALSGRVSYTGDVKTLYSLLQGYCTLNARIAKSFQQVTVFLEGRDLLDQPVKREFTSADESEVWAEIEYLNRRIILAGVTWSF